MTDKAKFLHILLIWEEFPESVDYYLIPTQIICRDERRMLKVCHGNFINSSRFDTRHADESVIEESLQILNLKITDINAAYINDQYKNDLAIDLNLSRNELDAIFGKWRRFKFDLQSPTVIPRVKIYRSGFWA